MPFHPCVLSTRTLPSALHRHAEGDVRISGFPFVINDCYCSFLRASEGPRHRDPVNRPCEKIHDQQSKERSVLIKSEPQPCRRRQNSEQSTVQCPSPDRDRACRIVRRAETGKKEKSSPADMGTQINRILESDSRNCYLCIHPILLLSSRVRSSLCK